MIEGFSTSEIQADSATLHAEINPKGAQSSYHFEYGTTPEYGTVVPIPNADIGAGFDAVPVSVHIEGLEPVTYHFRVVAENEWGEVRTADQSFDFFPPSCPNSHVRQETAANYLPDCRAYELASAEDAGGTTIAGSTGPWTAYASDPGRVAYAGMFGIIPGTGEAINTSGDLYIATRSTDGWTSKYVGRKGSETLSSGGAPGKVQEGIDKSQHGVLTNPSMDRIVIWASDSRPDINPVNNIGYMFDADGNFVTRLPTDFEQVPGSEKGLDCGGSVAGGFGCMGEVTAPLDLSHYIFSSSKFAYKPGGVVGGPGSAYDNDIDAGTTELISLTPEGDPIPRQAGDDKSTEYIRFPAVSADGSHILMSTEFNKGPISGLHLWMRANGEDNYDLTGNFPVRFAGMTKDGETVYFTPRSR